MKVKKKDFGAAFRYLYSHFCSHCHVTFPYKEILSFVGHCHVTFPNMKPLSFFGTFVQLIIKDYNSDSFDKITTRYSDGSHCARNNPQFYKKTSEKSLLICANTYESYIVCKTTASPITATRRVFYPFVNIISYYLEMFKSY